MSRKGNCYDNCIMETFFGRMKTEMYYGFEKEYKSVEDFSNAVDRYINYYNNDRIQEKNKMDVSCTIQNNIHVFRINSNFNVSRILGTHHNGHFYSTV